MVPSNHATVRASLRTKSALSPFNLTCILCRAVAQPSEDCESLTSVVESNDQLSTFVDLVRVRSSSMSCLRGLSEASAIACALLSTAARPVQQLRRMHTSACLLSHLLLDLLPCAPTHERPTRGTRIVVHNQAVAFRKQRFRHLPRARRSPSWHQPTLPSRHSERRPSALCCSLRTRAC